MAAPVSMKETAKAVRDASRTVEAAFPPGAPAEVWAAAFSQVLHEYLTYEYTDDLPVDVRQPQSLRHSRDASQRLNATASTPARVLTDNRKPPRQPGKG